MAREQKGGEQGDVNVSMAEQELNQEAEESSGQDAVTAGLQVRRRWTFHFCLTYNMLAWSSAGRIKTLLV